MVVQEADEVPPRFSMRAKLPLLGLFPGDEHIGDKLHGGMCLGHRWYCVEEGEIQRCVDAEAVDLCAVPPNEVVDRGLVAVGDLTEREEVLLANAEGKLADGVAEHLHCVRGEVFDRVDAEAIDIVLGDQVLVAANEDIEHRPLPVTGSQGFLARRLCVVLHHELAHGVEVSTYEASGRWGIGELHPAAPEELLALQIGWPDGVVRREGREWRECVLPVLAGKPEAVEPLDGRLLA